MCPVVAPHFDNIELGNFRDEKFLYKDGLKEEYGIKVWPPYSNDLISLFVCFCEVQAETSVGEPIYISYIDNNIYIVIKLVWHVRIEAINCLSML